MSSLRERLIEARTEAKLSQADLAKRAQCGQTTIASIENGRNQGSKILPRVATILGVEVLWLAEGKSPKRRRDNSAKAPVLPKGALDPRSVGDPFERISEALRDLVIVGTTHEDIMTLVRQKAEESKEQQRLILAHLNLKPATKSGKGK
jgi:transcriptional regulator with XRE-family HTH domain